MSPRTSRKTKTTTTSSAEALANSSPAASGVSEGERWALAVGGGALLLFGLTRRAWWGAIPALLGGSLLYRCATAGPAVTPKSRTERSPKRVPDAESVVVDRPADELYRFWRRLSNLPRFMENLESVTELGDGRSRWMARSDGGRPVQWDATIIQEREPEMLAWRSVPGGEVERAASVWFEPAPHGGTRVKLAIRESLRDFRLAPVLDRLLGKSPRDTAREDLRRFKQLMEAGEVATTKGQASARNPDF